MRIASAIFAAVLLAGCVTIPSIAQPEPEAASAVATWRSVDAETGQIRDIEGLEQLARDFPNSGNVRLRLLQPYLAAGEAEKVLETLEWLYDRGYVFGEVPQRQIPKLLEGVDPGRIAERLIAEAEVIERSKVFAETPSEVGLGESVIRDPKDDRLIVTSVSENAIFGRRAGQDWDGYSPQGAANISGIVLDQQRHIVWLASGHIDGSESADGFTGLIGLDHRNSSEIRIPAPEGVNISDLTIAPDGTVFGSDPLGGGIYAARHDSAEMVTIISPGTMRSPQGLALSSDGLRLYVSDYRYGIAAIERDSGRVLRLASDIPIILDGIDGLWRFGDELVAVQNGTSPMRIAAFRLSADGMRVVGHRVLEQAHTQWTEPLSGSVDGDSLLYIGNGQWDRFVQGEPAQDKAALPTQIRRLPLHRD
ncbi:hypothetical protein [Altererythrobacter sp. MF3-039]|uniref:hypothetical protein n=1 Tax=Altererythrobacter sp. MF3-039 TaxID=3252901 RepID=UPI00390CA6B6